MRWRGDREANQSVGLEPERKAVAENEGLKLIELRLELVLEKVEVTEVESSKVAEAVGLLGDKVGEKLLPNSCTRQASEQKYIDSLGVSPPHVKHWFLGREGEEKEAVERQQMLCQVRPVSTAARALLTQLSEFILICRFLLVFGIGGSYRIRKLFKFAGIWIGFGSVSKADLSAQSMRCECFAGRRSGLALLAAVAIAVVRCSDDGGGLLWSRGGLERCSCWFCEMDRWSS